MTTDRLFNHDFQLGDFSEPTPFDPYASASEGGNHPLQAHVLLAAETLINARDAIDDDEADKTELQETYDVLLEATRSIRWGDFRGRREKLPALDGSYNGNALADQLRDFLGAVHERLPKIVENERYRANARRHAEAIVAVHPLYAYHVWRQSFPGSLARSLHDAMESANATRSMRDTTADLFAEITELSKSLHQLVGSTAAPAIAKGFAEDASKLKGELNSVEARYRKWLFGGPIALLATFVIWCFAIWLNDQLEFAQTSTMLTGASLKLTVAFAWIWGLRLLSRDMVSIKHRISVASAKRTALLTYDVLRQDAEHDQRSMLMEAVAPLVFDPRSTGFFVNHQDGVSIGLKQVGTGTPSGT